MRWVTLCCLLAMAAACHKQSSAEDALRAAVSAMERAAEAKQIRPILVYLAEDFQGNGRLRKANIGGMLLLRFRQNQHVHVYLHIVDLQVTGMKATMRCQLILAGRDEKILPQRGRALVIDSDWQRRDGKWQVTQASWRDGLVQP